MYKMTQIALPRNIVLMVLIVGMLCLTPRATVAQEAPLQVGDFECFGGTIAERGDNGVTLRRTESHVDAGCNYMPDGRRIPLDADHNRILLHPSRRQNGAYCVVTITFEADLGNFVGEHEWIDDNGRGCIGLSELSLPDVREFAREHGIMGATHYFIKIRVQPWVWNRDGPALTFSRILSRPASGK